VRTAFFNALMELAELDPRIYLVVGDLGFGLVEPFMSRFPQRFVNAGIAEQNMSGIAAGLALSGKIVFIYSIANFPTLRCLEQIRNDICYHRANVKIVAVGGGFSYGSLGMSHHATEDLAIMRALPEMVTVAPGDPLEAAMATVAVAGSPGPCYLRLGRAGEPTIHHAPIEFCLGKAITVRHGDDLTLISTGAMLPLALEVAQKLPWQTRVLSMHTLKPLDEDAVMRAARETAVIFTLEEHTIIGGLGGAVAETLAEASELSVRFKRLGLPPVFSSHVGNQEYLRIRYGLGIADIMRTIRETMDRSGMGSVPAPNGA
jgi:transketolase